MPRGFRPLIRVKPHWDILMFPREPDNVKEIYGALGGRGSITCLVRRTDVEEYKRELSYLPPTGPSIYVYERTALREIGRHFHAAILLIPIDAFKKPEEILFEIYRVLYWHGYIEIIHFIPGGSEMVWNKQPDSHSIKLAALMRKTGFMLSDARAFPIADGLWVKVEGIKRENLSDEDIAY